MATEDETGAANDPNEIVGHKTMLDGTHVPLARGEAREIWQRVTAADAERRTRMPDSMSALHALHDALTRLKDEGWSEGCYCPKDGSEFAVIQYGSTGIFSGFYSGKWPDGHVMSCDFITHPSGLLWKSLDKLTGGERSKLDECMSAESIMHDREIAAFSSMDGHPIEAVKETR